MALRLQRADTRGNPPVTLTVLRITLLCSGHGGHWAALLRPEHGDLLASMFPYPLTPLSVTRPHLGHWGHEVVAPCPEPDEGCPRPWWPCAHPQLTRAPQAGIRGWDPGMGALGLGAGASQSAISAQSIHGGRYLGAALGWELRFPQLGTQVHGDGRRCGALLGAAHGG